MRLSTISSGFVFNMPSDFLPQEIINTYKPVLEKNFIQYDNIIDYLNSTILEINFPGLSLELPTQTIKRGKEINYRPVKNVHDIVSSRELDVTFRSVDNNLNYFLLWDIMIKHYLAVSDGAIPSNIQYNYINPFMVKNIDLNRDELYTISFRELILKNISDNKFSYNNQAYSESTFNLSFQYNWFDIEFSLYPSKILDISGITPVIQNIGQANSGFGILGTSSNNPFA